MAPPVAADAVFAWKPEWKKLLPVVRGVHVPPLPAAEPLLAKPPKVADDNAGAGMLARLAPGLQRELQSWSAARWSDQLQTAAGAGPDVDAWIELFAQARNRRNAPELLEWLARVGVHRHGPALVLQALLPVHSAALHFDSSRLEAAFKVVRHAVAVADDAAYAAALSVAEDARNRKPGQRAPCAHVFPHLPWGAEAARGQGRENGGDSYLPTCVMAAEELCRLMDFSHAEWQDLLPAVLLQVHLHGGDALPAIAHFLDAALRNEGMRRIAAGLELATRLHDPRVLPMLLRRLGTWRSVRPALDTLAQEDPAAVLQAGIREMAGGRQRAVESFVVRLAKAQPGALASALENLEPAARARFEKTCAALTPVEAAADALPEVLRTPPWLRADRPGELPVLDVQPQPTPEAVVLGVDRDPGSRFTVTRHYLLDAHGFPRELALTDAGARRLLAGQPLEPGDTSATYAGIATVLASPPQAQLALWDSFPSHLWSDTIMSVNVRTDLDVLLERFGVAALPALLRIVGTHEGKSPHGALRIDSPQLVDRMTHLLRNTRTHCHNAGVWIERFPRTMLMRALPQCFAAQATPLRDNARHAVRWLAARGHRAQVLDAAQAYGEAMADATRALLDTDPLFVLPGAIPALPAFVDAEELRKPLLREGGALPAAAVGHLATMLRLSTDDAPYAGLALVKEACTPASLGEFAWDLFEAWLSAGAPAKEGWAFRALGWIGDDEVARRLHPRINEWSLDASTRARAEVGLRLLATIGSDVALMLLNVLATKGKHRRVQEKASAMIEAVAEARGLTLDELSDRLVPTLGLDEAGAQVLDFGPRNFHLSFDEQLRPVVSDAQSLRLKDLPKPNKADDAERAAAAVARFKDLKKDVKTIASLQVTRLERAMLLQRRWPAAAFRRFFLEHPLVRHLAARLAWGRYEGERCVQLLRVAEDWTLTDVHDAHFTLAEDAVLGLPHPLEMPPEQRVAIAQLFADYELLQPFQQLARETFALEEQERQADALHRWKDRDVAIGSLLGLTQRGWQRGQPEDGGMICTLLRPVNEQLRLQLRFDPGFFVGGGTPEYRQTLHDVHLLRDGHAAVRFDELDPIPASELVRDLAMLARAREDLA